MKRTNSFGKSVFEFPPLELADEDGLLAVGGNLSPEQLLYAYSQGIFPWYNDNEPILWWSPNPRFVLYPKKLKVTKNNKKIVERGSFSITFDKAFRAVINGCKNIPRKEQDGTWITNDVLEAYCNLHQMGYAHSVEAWQEGELVGGLYGVCLGNVFFGESMFSKVSGASKVAFINLVKNLQQHQFQLIDCQVYTPYLESFGAQMIRREDFVSQISKGIENEGFVGNWENLMKVNNTL